MKPLIRKSVLLLFAACMLTCLAMGQSTGEVCIIGMNSNAPDQVLIVTLVDLSGSLDIFFTDNEWDGSAWVTGEGFEKYTTPIGGLSAGDVVELDFADRIASVGTMSFVDGAFNLNYNDQLYMYLGSNYSSPTTFLFVITTYGGWDTNELTNTNLTNGTDALIFSGSNDYNVRYDGTRSGTVAELKTAIADKTTNWVTSLDSYTFSTTAFTINDTPLPITLASFTATTVNGTVELAWETATETNNTNFVIYRNDVAISSVAGAGTTSEPHNYSYVDNTVVPGVTYTYVLADVDYSNTETKYLDEAVTVTVGNDIMEADFVVGAAYPNPFNPTAIVPLELSRAAMVKASLYDLNGREVKALVNANFTAGTHELHIDGSGLTTGLYLVQVVVENVVDVQKIALMK